MKAWRQKPAQEQLRKTLIEAANKLPDSPRKFELIATLRRARMGQRLKREITPVLTFPSVLLQNLMLRAGVWPGQQVEVAHG